MQQNLQFAIPDITIVVSEFGLLKFHVVFALMALNSIAVNPNYLTTLTGICRG